MRIALLAPVMLPVPPVGYGGTELVVSMLAEGLVRRGHDVTLFASGDSVTRAHLAATYPRALAADGIVTKRAYLPYEVAHVARVFARATEFDLVHDHTKTLGVRFAQESETPWVTTIHNDFTPERRAVYTRFRGHPFVAISHAQEARCPELNYVGVVHNGIDLREPLFRERKEDYMVFLGRMAAVKGAHVAVRVAHETGRPLVLAGKVDPVDAEYYRREVEPWVDGQRVRYVGEVHGRAKWELLAGARCLLFPLQWPEPFGLVSIEAMACGTPVVAAPLGALPEVVDPGSSGILVPPGGDWGEAVRAAGELDPRACRAWVEDRFGADRMVDGYLEVYRKLVARRGDRVPVGA